MRDFQTEEELVIRFLISVENGALSSYAVNRDSVILREVECGQGRTDVIQAFYKLNNPDDCRPQLPASLANLTSSTIVSKLHYHSPRKLEYLMKQTGYTEGTVKKHLTKLEQEDIVKEVDGKFVLSSAFRIPELEVWSYEAKLHDWRRATYQALQYRAFSHRIFLVFPESSLTRIDEKLQMLKKLNVGLIGVNGDGELTIHYSPKKQEPSSRRFHVLALGQILGGMKSIKFL